ncbi:hypothetical protein PoB_004550700 [Plakobranchus ocellatus]|uniref:Uncharacterized protein n=1 Tax=Plakobranchus ocellatus TaxID=259542 RepID=A0AAV4BI37_9GAST|nr:hypothetical protein PoB_004550700 [Plakobranchus ocellatus]
MFKENIKTRKQDNELSNERLFKVKLLEALKLTKANDQRGKGKERSGRGSGGGGGDDVGGDDDDAVIMITESLAEIVYLVSAVPDREVTLHVAPIMQCPDSLRGQSSLSGSGVQGAIREESFSRLLVLRKCSHLKPFSVIFEQ